MKIQKQPTSITITFSPKDYWLRKNTIDPDWLGEYVLVHRIDMSHKGKSDQEGSIVMFLSEDEVRKFKEAGFVEIL